MIEVRELEKHYGSLRVLKGIDLDVEKGEVPSIIGVSGSGKSTLLYCINGLEAIQNGFIKVDGTDVHKKRTNINQMRQNMGMVFQQWNSFPHLTALENVALASKIVKGISQAEARDIVVNQLEYLGLGDKLNVNPGALSAGQQKRLAIVRALAKEPECRLFDQAT